jgi:hypothetical protein
MAYFSGNSATLPAANATGKLTLRPFSVVHSIIYDEGQRSEGVRVITETKGTGVLCEDCFVNAGALNSLLYELTSLDFRTDLATIVVSWDIMMFHNYRGQSARRTMATMINILEDDLRACICPVSGT